MSDKSIAKIPLCGMSVRHGENIYHKQKIIIDTKIKELRTLTIQFKTPNNEFYDFNGHENFVSLKLISED